MKILNLQTTSEICSYQILLAYGNSQRSKWAVQIGTRQSDVIQCYVPQVRSSRIQHSCAKAKVFNYQEPPSGESTSLALPQNVVKPIFFLCVVKVKVNFYHRMWGQLSTTWLITEVAQWGTPSCSRPKPATDNGVWDGISNWLVAPPTLIGSTPWAPRTALC